ncbi:hypothetical protein HD806DRAFT_519938 [Xylariaceae sp. AK1471]|nr:hypothetical protein HD806DRAFT_519938 [Xylariaceae sp. AK1471]
MAFKLLLPLTEHPGSRWVPKGISGRQVVCFILPLCAKVLTVLRVRGCKRQDKIPSVHVIERNVHNLFINQCSEFLDCNSPEFVQIVLDNVIEGLEYRSRRAIIALSTW